MRIFSVISDLASFLAWSIAAHTDLRFAAPCALITGFEMPFNARAKRMGRRCGIAGVEMLTLENGQEIARWLLPYSRAAARANPEVGTA